LIPRRRRSLGLLWVAALMLPALAGAQEASPQTLQHFLLLEQALPRYQALASQPALTQLPALPGRSLKPGDTYAGNAALRRLLVATGDLTVTQAPEPDVTLDETLVAAIQHFQERHGLETDGVLGPRTWRALTTPMSQRVHQIERTLQRWRELPPNPYRRAIFVNIPRFRLYAITSMQDSEASMLQINVVVGRTIEDLHTPTFVADLTHVIFRPYWEVPRKITMQELLPAARANPDYLTSHHYELVSAAGAVVPENAANLAALAAGRLRLRQRPGEDNALGAVKFMMPNPYDVYLHDTPARALFTRVTRAYSHGCVRVGDPAALAEFVLQDDATWTRERIEEAMRGTEPLRVNLSEPIRVYFVYGTAIAREDGSVLFLDDLYGLEKR
jgi:murein L,D-transpeptidase YcbB/YkuD